MNIDKYTIVGPNLNENQGLITINGLAAQQNQYAPLAFANLLESVRPKRILEIGTSLGGLTEFFRQISQEIDLPLDIVTYDVHRHSWFDDLQAKGVADYRTKSIWENDVLENGICQESIDFIKQEGTTVVLCDGGSKKHEFASAAKHLKPGDIILAHDYAPNKDVFDAQIDHKLWNWCEITDDDISETCITQNLVSFMHEEFSNAVWVCKRKS
jgi:predicted O-methyltransferase YrrM